MNYLVLNYKTYPESTAEKAVELTRIVDEVQRQNKHVQIIVSPQTSDLYLLKSKFPEVIFWAQHVDPLYPERNTGWITPHAVEAAGASGAMFNHSEHIIPNEMISHSLDILTEMKMQSCLLLATESTLDEVFKLHSESDSEHKFASPTFVAFEPPELIGGDVSPLDDEYNLGRARSALQTFDKYGSIPLLGAGIKKPEDVSRSIELGYRGVLLASGFVKSDSPMKFLEDMLQAFPN